MSDEAPRSSKHVLRLLNRHITSDAAVDRMEVTTTVRQASDGIRFRAVTTVTRPKMRNEAEYAELDREVAVAFKSLPGCDGTYSLAGVSQTYEVEWDGICRPI
jgi:hypothetical protein